MSSPNGCCVVFEENIELCWFVVVKLNFAKKFIDDSFYTKIIALTYPDSFINIQYKKKSA